MDCQSAEPRFPKSKEEYQSLLPLEITDALLQSWVAEHCTGAGSKRFARQRYETFLANHFSDADEEEEEDAASCTTHMLVATGISTNNDVPAYLLEQVSQEYPNDTKAMNVARFCYKTLTNHKDEGICVKLNINNVDDGTCDEPLSSKKRKVEVNSSSQSKQTKATFTHHMTSTYRDMISRTVAPSFSSRTSGITGKSINFGSSYNKFMAKFTALVSIISTHPPISIESSEDSGDDDDCDGNKDSNQVLQVYRDSVSSTASLIHWYLSNMTSNPSLETMSQSNFARFNEGKRFYDNVATNMKVICGSIVTTGHRSQPLLKATTAFLQSKKAVENWIESFVNSCRKMHRVGTFSDSDNYSNEHLWIDFNNLLNEIGVYFE